MYTPRKKGAETLLFTEVFMKQIDRHLQVQGGLSLIPTPTCCLQATHIPGYHQRPQRDRGIHVHERPKHPLFAVTEAYAAHLDS